MIHYHGTPITGEPTLKLCLQGKHACISFADSRDIDIAAEVCQSFMLDNGAFSAWRSGTPFDREGFAEWVETWYRHPACDFYLIPDVIDGDHHDNAKMRAWWFHNVDGSLWDKGVPVWHLHEPLDVLRDLLNGFRRVAFGSSGEFADVGTPAWWNRMAEGMDVATDDQGHPIKPLHGLRMLDPTVFSHFPFSSADSTNVARRIGQDGEWRDTTFSPVTQRTRALVVMERIEAHASAARWTRSTGGYMTQKNMDLLG